MNPYKPAIKQGIILGAIGVLVHLVIYAIDPKLFLHSSFGIFSGVLLGLAAPIVCMIIGAKKTRPNFVDYTFGKAFSAAFIVGVTAVVVSFCYTMLFNNVIDTEMADWLYNTKMEEQMEKLEDAGYDDEMIERTKASAASFKKYTTGNLGTLLMHGLSIFWYLILALIIGAVQKDRVEGSSVDVDAIGKE